jgi:pyruvate dehydrogenase E2 component (dihydrolipoamide acetyltransferase)
MAEIVMPRLSDSMEEGTILKWLKGDGDRVGRGEPLAEIETDKATLTFESDAAGVLTIVVAAGETLPIGAVIARLDDGSGDAAGEAPAPDPSAAAPVEPPVAADPSAPAEAPGAGQPSAPWPTRTTGRVKASPLARRMARERGIDLHAVIGTGPGGRVVKADVEEAAEAGAARLSDAARAGAPPTESPAQTPPSSASRAEAPPAADPQAQAPPTAPARALTAEAPATEAPAPAEPGQPEPEPSPPAPTAPPGARSPTLALPPPVPTATAKGDVTVVELTRVQQVIARRMSESKATVPEFTLRSEIDMEGCVKLRAELKALGGEVPSYNDMVVKACALALREYPRANGSYKDGKFELHSRVNVGVAVAATDALVVPTIFDADHKSLREIARETRALAEKVRAGTVAPPELSGGTFTVSNLGMFGVTDFTAVINPPQAAILAVGALAPRAVVRDGELVARNTMGVTLACDHRILYGADAAQFLARVRVLLEQPLALAF